MDKLAGLIMLATTYCPWVPSEPVEVAILPDAWYELFAPLYPINLKHTWGLTLRNAETPLILLRQSTANERVLCHEYRHVEEGAWHD